MWGRLAFCLGLCALAIMAACSPEPQSDWRASDLEGPIHKCAAELNQPLTTGQLTMLVGTADHAVALSALPRFFADQHMSPTVAEANLRDLKIRLEPDGVAGTNNLPTSRSADDQVLIYYWAQPRHCYRSEWIGPDTEVGQASTYFVARQGAVVSNGWFWR